MNPRPVVPRTLASQDVEDAIGHYLKQDAQQAALAFVDALGTQADPDALVVNP
ncbi:MAG: hypothetical protein ACYCO9_01310 [Streptosporangiaceae bacterium]